MKFKKLSITEWQQFQDIEIDFHERLTILTGANGSGKTTILGNILANHIGWGFQSCAVPKKNIITGVTSFFSRMFQGKDLSSSSIGNIHYSNNQNSSIEVPNQNSAQYQIQIPNQLQIDCFFIPSNRPVFRYQAVSNIPFGKKDKQTAFTEVSNATKGKYHGGNTHSTSYFMKNTLISWAIQGYGVKSRSRDIMPSDPEQIDFFEGFKCVLKKLLPKTLGFEDFEIREREIVFICNNGDDEFILEQASGGISALIDIAWQIYMFSTTDNKSFTVIIDEVENHLHPTMQRQILPNLLEAFPNTSFIVSTHSPLIVGSVRDSNVYVLKYNENKKIISEKLDIINQAKTATEILNEVLGVSFTMPIWAEVGLNNIISKYSSNDMTKDKFEQMRNELKEIGLEKLMPDAIFNLLEKNND